VAQDHFVAQPYLKHWCAPRTGMLRGYKSRAPLPVADLKAFSAYTKANRSKMQFGSAGAGSGTHVTCLLLNSAIGVDITDVLADHDRGGKRSNINARRRQCRHSVRKGVQARQTVARPLVRRTSRLMGR
jgi:hypothetical protein